VSLSLVSVYFICFERTPTDAVVGRGSGLADLLFFVLKKLHLGSAVTAALWRLVDVGWKDQQCIGVQWREVQHHGRGVSTGNDKSLTARAVAAQRLLTSML